MDEFTFSGWVKIPVKFAIRDCDRNEAIRRAQLGDYDAYSATDAPPIDFAILSDAPDA